MYALERNLEDQIKRIDKPKPGLIFPEINDARVMIAASKLFDYADILIPSPQENVKNLIITEKIALEVSVEEFMNRLITVDIDESHLLQNEFQTELLKLGQGKKWQLSTKEAAEWARNPLIFSIMMVRKGYANAILGGLHYASKDYFTPCLRLLEKEKPVFELGLFVLPDEHPSGIFKENIVVFSDVAINPAPNAEALANIALGTCKIVRDLIPESVLPTINGAIVCYSTKGSGEGASIELVREAEKMMPAKLAALRKDNPSYTTIQIESELQMSVAISEKAARKKIKAIENHPAAGKANVIIVTNLDFGNSLYHLYATTWPESLKLLQIGGLYSQALDFSRSSTVEDVVLAAKALLLQILKKTDYNGRKAVIS